MTAQLHLRRLLWTAGQLPGAPAVEDYGSLVLAVQRAHATAFGRAVYASPLLKAAALWQSLALLKPLEHSNGPFGFVAARAFLATHGVSVKADGAELRRFLLAIAPGRAGLTAIRDQLSRWSTTGTTGTTGTN